MFPPGPCGPASAGPDKGACGLLHVRLLSLAPVSLSCQGGGTEPRWPSSPPPASPCPCSLRSWGLGEFEAPGGRGSSLEPGICTKLPSFRLPSCWALLRKREAVPSPRHRTPVAQSSLLGFLRGQHHPSPCLRPQGSLGRSNTSAGPWGPASQAALPAIRPRTSTMSPTFGRGTPSTVLTVPAVSTSLGHTAGLVSQADRGPHQPQKGSPPPLNSRTCPWLRTGCPSPEGGPWAPESSGQMEPRGLGAAPCPSVCLWNPQCVGERAWPGALTLLGWGPLKYASTLREPSPTGPRPRQDLLGGTSGQMLRTHT